MNKHDLLCIVVVLWLGSTAFAETSSPNAQEPKQEWWTPTNAGWVGGIGGSVVGLLGAVVGGLASFSSTRRSALYLAGGTGILGVVVLAAGIISVVQSQPYHIYYPLLLGGFITTVVFWVQIPILRRRIRETELQKMSAQDIQG